MTQNSKFEQDLFQKASEAYRDGNIENAIFIMNKLIQVNPTSATYSTYLGTIYFELKRYHLSRDYFKAATKSDPNSKTASMGYFHSSWGLGFIKAALNEIERYSTNNHLKYYQETLNQLMNSKQSIYSNYTTILRRINATLIKNI